MLYYAILLPRSEGPPSAPLECHLNKPCACLPSTSLLSPAGRQGLGGEGWAPRVYTLQRPSTLLLRNQSSSRSAVAVRRRAVLLEDVELGCFTRRCALPASELVSSRREKLSSCCSRLQRARRLFATEIMSDKACLASAMRSSHSSGFWGWGAVGGGKHDRGRRNLTFKVAQSPCRSPVSFFLSLPPCSLSISRLDLHRCELRASGPEPPFSGSGSFRSRAAPPHAAARQPPACRQRAQTPARSLDAAAL